MSNWDSSEGTNIYLDGKWEFYPNLLLTPQNDFSQYRNIKKYVHVPGSWESYLNDDGSVDGSGTYRLRINLPSDDIYGIKSRTIRFSSRIFINDEEIISTEPGYRLDSPSFKLWIHIGRDYKTTRIWHI